MAESATPSPDGSTLSAPPLAAAPLAAAPLPASPDAAGAGEPGDGLAGKLELLVQLAVANLGCSTEVSFSLAPRGGDPGRTLAASSERASALDALQRRCGRGPGCDALSGGGEAGGLLPDGRWPELSEAAAGHGVRSVWALPIGSGEAAVGWLSLYRETGDPWQGPQASTARVLAVLAEELLADARTVAQLTRGNDTLQMALETRTVIGQAQGILMARQGIGAAAAFDVLRRASQRSNRKLREIAAELVAGVERQPGTPMAARRPR